MYDTFLAVILMCAVNGGLDVPDSCKYVQDKRGPVGTRVSCQKRLDELWVRIEKNTEFLTKLHKEIGDYKLSYASHRGFCVDPKLGPEKEIKKYYFP
jgi:hypothetical protein